MLRAHWPVTSAAAARIHVLLLLGVLAAAARAATLGDPVNAAGDDLATRVALQSLYNSTGGPNWLTAPGAQLPWGSPTSYCRWAGVSCCINSPLTRVQCNDSRSVVALDVAGFGLQGQLPTDIAVLPELVVLNLQDNPGLAGPTPAVWLPPTLLWLSVQNTSLVACTAAAPTHQLPSSACVLPTSLQLLDSSNDPAAAIQCPAVQLLSFKQRAGYPTASARAARLITAPYAQPVIPGTVIADPSFTLGYQCVCSSTGQAPVAVAPGSLQLLCAPWNRDSTGSNDTRWTVIVVLVSILPHVLIALAVLLWFKHRAYLKQLLWFKEAVLQRKRGKVPGTPGYVLQNGHGWVPLGDALVTWVCTDVACSTKLWEWDATVMDMAIDIHNRIVRQLLDELGGHEIRNEGDSFVLSFHEALDGIHFCLKAQERLQNASWPDQLIQHSSAATVTVGDLLRETSLSGTGAVVMAGLRVRMGINTGMPDDIFLHDMTERVDYRGPEYDLTAEICDMACGGQILVGPKTYQSWMRTSADMGPDLWGHLSMMSESTYPKEEAGRAPSRSLSLRHSLLSNTSMRVLSPADGMLGAPASPTEANTAPLTTRMSGDWLRGAAGHHMAGQPTALALPSRTCSQPAMAQLHGMQAHIPAAGSCRDSPRSRLQSLDLQHPMRTSSGRMALHHVPQHLATHMPSHMPPHMLLELAPTRSFDSSTHGQEPLPALDTQVSVSPNQACNKADKGDSTPGLAGKGLLVRLRHQSLLSLMSGSVAQASNDDLHTRAGSQGGTGSAPQTPCSARTRGQGLTRVSLHAHGSGTCDGASGSGAGDMDEHHMSTQDLAHVMLPPVRDQPRKQHSSSRLAQCMACLWCPCSRGTDDNMPWDSELQTIKAHSKAKRKALDKVESMVLDMGYYAWDRGPAGRAGSVQAGEHVQQHAEANGFAAPAGQVVVHLVQLLPLALAPRALLFTWPLPAQEQWEKISPGFFDAPGSGSAMLPGMREVFSSVSAHVPQRPVVTLSFSSIEGIKEVAAYDLRLAQYTTSLYNSCVRETLSVCHGYECKESEGAFMAAFTAPCAAAEWALTLQLALLHLPWPDELLAHHEWAREVRDADTDQLVFRGLRAKVGIYTGSVDRVVPHCKTGRADYYGQAVNRAARLMTAAHGGQVVCDAGLKELLLKEWAAQNIVAQQLGNTDLAPSLSVPLPAAGRPQSKEQSRTSNNTAYGNRALKSALSLQTGRQDAACVPPRSVSWKVRDPKQLIGSGTATCAAAGRAGDAFGFAVTIDASAGTDHTGFKSTGLIAAAQQGLESVATGAVTQQAGTKDVAGAAVTQGDNYPSGVWLQKCQAADEILPPSSAAPTPAPTPARWQAKQTQSAPPVETRIARSYAGSFTRPHVRAGKNQMHRVASTASVSMILYDKNAACLTLADSTPAHGRSMQLYTGQSEPVAQPHLSIPVNLTQLLHSSRPASGTATPQATGRTHYTASQPGHADLGPLPSPCATPLTGRRDCFSLKSSRLSSMDLSQVEVQPAAWNPIKHSRASSSTPRRPSSVAASSRSMTAFATLSPRSAVASTGASPHAHAPPRAPHHQTAADGNRPDMVPYWLISSADMTPRSAASAICSMPDLTSPPASHGYMIPQHLMPATAAQNSNPCWESMHQSTSRSTGTRSRGAGTAHHRRRSLQPAAPLQSHLRNASHDPSAAWIMVTDMSAGEPSGGFSSLAPGPGTGGVSGQYSVTDSVPHSWARAPGLMDDITRQHLHVQSIFSTMDAQEMVSLENSDGMQSVLHAQAYKPAANLPVAVTSARGSVQEGLHLDTPTLSASSGQTPAASSSHFTYTTASQQHQQPLRPDHVSVLVPQSFDVARASPTDEGYLRLSSTGAYGHTTEFMLNTHSRNHSLILPKIMSQAASPHTAVQSPTAARDAATDASATAHHENRLSMERGSSTSGGRSMRALLRSIDLGSLALQQAMNPRTHPRTSHPRVSPNVRSMQRASTGLPPAAAAKPDDPAPATSTVLAQCFKISISPQADDGTSSSVPVPAARTSQSGGITLIKYTRTPGLVELDEELARLDEEEAMQPLAAGKPVPMVPVEIGIWGLGAYRLKGVTELIRVVQLLPTCLDKRMEQLDKAGLAKGKARCIQRHVVHTEKLTLMLPDVTKLSCCCWNASSSHRHHLSPADACEDSPRAANDLQAMGNGGTRGALEAAWHAVEQQHTTTMGVGTAHIMPPRNPADACYLFPDDDALTPIKEHSSLLPTSTMYQSSQSQDLIPAAASSQAAAAAAAGDQGMQGVAANMSSTGSRLQQCRPTTLSLPVQANAQLAATTILGSNGQPAVLHMGPVHVPPATPSSYNASLPSGTLPYVEARNSSSEQQGSGPLTGSQHTASCIAGSFPLPLPREAALAYLTEVHASRSTAADQLSLQRLAADFLLTSTNDSSPSLHAAASAAANGTDSSILQAGNTDDVIADPAGFQGARMAPNKQDSPADASNHKFVAFSQQAGGCVSPSGVDNNVTMWPSRGDTSTLPASQTLTDLSQRVSTNAVGDAKSASASVRTSSANGAWSEGHEEHLRTAATALLQAVACEQPADSHQVLHYTHYVGPDQRHQHHITAEAQARQLQLLQGWGAGQHFLMPADRHHMVEQWAKQTAHAPAPLDQSSLGDSEAGLQRPVAFSTAPGAPGMAEAQGRISTARMRRDASMIGASIAAADSNLASPAGCSSAVGTDRKPVIDLMCHPSFKFGVGESPRLMELTASPHISAASSPAVEVTARQFKECDGGLDASRTLGAQGGGVSFDVVANNSSSSQQRQHAQTHGPRP